jgi:DNA-binding protein YbaB
VVDGDPLEELARLRDRADSLVQKFAATRTGAAFTGADRSGALTVTVDEAGRVANVRVGKAWRTRIGVDALADAVLEAVRAAAAARLRVWAEAFVEQQDAPDPRPGPMPSAFRSTAGQLDELATAPMTSNRGLAALEELLAMARAIERGIDEVSAKVRAHLETTYTGHSASRHVAVTITGGGAVADIRFDPRWLDRAHEISVGRETADAFRAAYRQAGERTIDDVVAQTPIGEVQALGRDPLGLARRLYLRND